VAVVRIGDAAGPNTLNIGSGNALPVFLDFIDMVSGSVRLTTAVPARSDGVNRACTLTFADDGDGRAGSTVTNWGFDTEGQASNNNAQTQLFFGCHTAPSTAAGVAVDYSSQKTIAVARMWPSFDVRVEATHWFRAFDGGTRGSATGFRSVLSTTGDSFYMIGISGANYGLQYLPSHYATSTTRIYGSQTSGSSYAMGTMDLRGLGMSASGKLLISSSQLVESASRASETCIASSAVAYPTTTQELGSFSMLPGFSGCRLWGFSFGAASSSTLYVVQDLTTYASMPSTPNGRLMFARTRLRSAVTTYTRSGANWNIDRPATVTIDGHAVYTLTPRIRGSIEYIYTSSRQAVFEINTVTNTARTLATAAPGTQFRGLALPPLPTSPPTPTTTGTADPTSSPSATVSPSRTRSISRSKKAKRLIL